MISVFAMPSLLYMQPVCVGIGLAGFFGQNYDGLGNQ